MEPISQDMHTDYKSSIPRTTSIIMVLLAILVLALIALSFYLYRANLESKDETLVLQQQITLLQNKVTTLEDAQRVQSEEVVSDTVSDNPNDEESSIDVGAVDLVIKDPILEYEEPDKSYSDYTVVGYTDRPLAIGTEFFLESSAVAKEYENQVADIQLKLTNVSDGTVTVDVLADRSMSGEIYERSVVESVDITSGTCIHGYEFVTDVTMSYCFEIGDSDAVPTLEYTIQMRGSMPGPF